MQLSSSLKTGFSQTSIKRKKLFFRYIIIIIYLKILNTFSVLKGNCRHSVILTLSGL